MLPHWGHLDTLSMCTTWCFLRKVVLGVASVLDPLFSPPADPVVVSVCDFSFPWFAGPVVVLVRDNSSPWIACPVVVLVRARPFFPIVGQGLFRGSAVWVTLFPILVLVCAPNCLPPDRPEGRHCFNNST